MSLHVLGVLTQLTVALTAPDTVRARAPFTVTLEVGAPAGRSIVVTPPAFAPFTIVKSVRLIGRDSTGPAARAIRGVWERHEYRYTLQAPAAGRFGFSPFVVRAAPQQTRSRALAFVVQDVAPSPARPRVLSAAPVNPARPVDVHAVISADTVWRGQQLTYSVGVFLDDFARTRLRRNPEFVPPEVRGAISYPLRGAPRIAFSRDVGGKQYSAYVFERALFPVAAGEVQIPAARLTYALPQGPGYFSREESFTLAAESLRVVVREPPVDGRPGDWRGAVGLLTVAARVDTVRARVGDPVTFTLRVNGSGNIELLPRPSLTVAGATLVNGSERVSIDSTGPALRGVKEFDWLLTPRDTGRLVIPRVRYPFFDPQRASYRTVESATIELTITPGATVATTSGDAVTAEPTDRPVIDAPFALAASPALRRAPGRQWWWWWGLLMAATGLALAAPRRRRAVRRDGIDDRAALAAQSAPRDATEAALARRRWLNALGARVPAALDSVNPDDLARAVRRQGARDATVTAIRDAAARLDRVAFGGAPLSELPPLPQLVQLLDAIDDETVRTARVPAAAAAWLLAVLLVLPRAVTMAQSPSAWSRGVGAYTTGQFPSARAAFSEVVAGEPDDVAAWRNLGLSAWRAADTATTLWAWQRALRLDPRDAVVRAQLEQLPALQVPEDAAVPPVGAEPVRHAAIAVAGLALIAALVSRRTGATRGWRRLAIGAAVASAATVGAAEWLARRIDRPGVAVALRDASSRREPAMTADPVAAITAGDILPVLDTRPGWVRIRVDATHDGWLPASYIGPLDRGPRLR